MSEFKLEVGQIFKRNINGVDYTFEVVKIDGETIFSKTDFSSYLQYKGLLPHSIDVFNLCVAEYGKNLIK